MTGTKAPEQTRDQLARLVKLARRRVARRASSLIEAEGLEATHPSLASAWYLDDATNELHQALETQLRLNRMRWGRRAS